MSNDNKKETNPKSTINKNGIEKHPVVLFDIEKQNYYANIKIETKRHVHRFADDMLLYFANTHNAVKINEWAVIKGVSTDRMHDWRQKYPYFDEIYKRCLEMLAVRRYKMTLDKSYNPFPLSHTQHLYDEEWRKGNEHADERKKKIEGVKSGNVIVEMAPAPRTVEVPDKQKDNNDQ